MWNIETNPARHNVVNEASIGSFPPAGKQQNHARWLATLCQRAVSIRIPACFNRRSRGNTQQRRGVLANNAQLQLAFTVDDRHKGQLRLAFVPVMKSQRFVPAAGDAQPLIARRAFKLARLQIRDQIPGAVNGRHRAA